MAILIMQITPAREDQDHHRSSVVFLEEMDEGARATKPQDQLTGAPPRRAAILADLTNNTVPGLVA